jgi:hypothetical protein
MMAGMVGSALLHPVFLVILVNDLLLAPAAMAAGLTSIQKPGADGAGAGLWCRHGRGVRALKLRRLNELMPSIATMPVYWLLISVGGWLALWQLLRAPFHWNKTAHGISRIYRRQHAQPMR